MKDDFGYFGSGLEGYVHYMEEFNRNFKNTNLENAACDDSWDTDSDDDFDEDCDCEDDLDVDYEDIDAVDEDNY